MLYDIKKTNWTKRAIIILVAASLLSCVPKNHLPLFQRSAVINDNKTVETILSKATLVETNDPDVNNLKILELKGTPYEMGFQHGRLLSGDIRENIHHIIRIVKLFAEEDMMDEIYDLMASYIPLEEKEEMRGLAHGAGIPLKVIHWIHCIPEVSEYGPKKKFRRWLKQTSCTNVVAFGKATVDGELYQLRVLDWMRNLDVQKWPVILVHQPDTGNASVTFSYAGFIGCISGMNEKNMAFGEKGYGNPPGESLEGIPFVFLFRKLLREADTLEDAKKIISNARRTCSYSYVVSDAKTGNGKGNALLFITDRNRCEVYEENTVVFNERAKMTNPAFDDVVYLGARDENLQPLIAENHGKISPEILKTIAAQVSLKGNMQNVIFKPKTLEAWVSNAGKGSGGEKGRACNQKWFYFNWGEALSK